MMAMAVELVVTITMTKVLIVIVIRCSLEFCREREKKIESILCFLTKHITK